MSKVVRPLLLAALAVLVPACGSGGDSDSPPPGPAYDATVAQAALQSHASLMFAMYADSTVLAQALKAAVDAFVAAPDAPLHAACKTAWQAARPFYIQSEAGRFGSGPIDRSPDGPEGFLNAWPLDENYIENGTTGIIDDAATYPAIDEPTLRGANENGSETNISTGWHAVEFLLWGIDGTLGAGGGGRSHTDFVGAGATATRRRAYLSVVTQLLVDDLTWVRNQWATGNPANYRAEFLALPVATALSRIMTGMGTLAFGELRGERILVPFTTKDKEDEHSCFSDTTHLDHLNDSISIQNLWNGSYTSSNGANNFTGTGIKHVAQTASSAQSALVELAVAANVAALQAPALNPFESAIQGLDTDPGRTAIQAAMNALSDFNTKFSSLASQMGISISTAVP